MGLVSGFTDELVTPLETAAGQIRQLSEKHREGNTHLQSQIQTLMASFGGNGANALTIRVHKQGQFVTGITNELDETAGIFEKGAGIIQDAAAIADDMLGGPPLELADKVLQKLAPHTIVRRGESAVTAITSDMRQNFHQLLHHSGGVLSNLVHGHIGAAFHDAEHTLGDLAHLGEDLFAFLDQVETILGRWAAKVMEGANWVANEFQSVLFKVEDFLFGYSDIAENTAILVDPNSTGTEKALAATGLTVTVAGDILMFIPGGQEGKVAAKGAEEALDEAVKLAEQEAVKEIEKQVETVIVQDLEKTLIQHVETTIVTDGENTIYQRIEYLLVMEGDQAFAQITETKVEQKVEQEIEKEIEEKGEQEAEKEGLTNLDKVDLVKSIIDGNVVTLISLAPGIRTAFNRSLDKVADWAISKALTEKYGEEGVKKILEDPLKKHLVEVAGGKAKELVQKEFVDKWTKGPFEHYKEGLISDSELEKETEQLAEQIMQSQP